MTERFKVSRKEYYRQRPKWLQRLLFTLSPDVYSAEIDKESAVSHLACIEKVLRTSSCLSVKKNFEVRATLDQVAVWSIKSGPIVVFYIHSVSL